MQNLQNLVNSSAAGWTIMFANSINDAGQIVGYGTDPSGKTEGFLLTPTPEPATITLLGSALSLLAGFGLLKRRRMALAIRVGG